MACGLHPREIPFLVFWLSLLAGSLLGQKSIDPVRVIFLGDTGTGKNGQRAVRDEIVRTSENIKIEKIFMAGDNIYEIGRPQHFHRKFLDIYAPLFRREIPFHAALGNHDVQKCRAAPSKSGSIPRDATAYRLDSEKCWVDQHLALSEFGYVDAARYYSVEIGEAPTPLGEVFVLDSNTLASTQTKLKSSDLDQAQLDWLEKALRESEAQWKIAMFHHPIYTPAADRFWPHKSELKMRKQLEQLLLDGQVDVVMQGHNHFYARLKPQHGIRYFVTGSGGAGAYGFKPDGMTIDRPDRGKFNHFLLVALSPGKLHYCTIDSQGNVRDGGWFTKGSAQDTPFDPGKCPIRDSRTSCCS